MNIYHYEFTSLRDNEVVACRQKVTDYLNRVKRWNMLVLSYMVSRYRNAADTLTAEEWEVKQHDLEFEMIAHADVIIQVQEHDLDDLEEYFFQYVEATVYNYTHLEKMDVPVFIPVTREDFVDRYNTFNPINTISRPEIMFYDQVLVSQNVFTAFNNLIYNYQFSMNPHAAWMRMNESSVQVFAHWVERKLERLVAASQPPGRPWNQALKQHDDLIEGDIPTPQVPPLQGYVRQEYDDYGWMVGAATTNNTTFSTSTPKNNHMVTNLPGDIIQYAFGSGYPYGIVLGYRVGPKIYTTKEELDKDLGETMDGSVFNTISYGIYNLGSGKTAPEDKIKKKIGKVFFVKGRSLESVKQEDNPEKYYQILDRSAILKFRFKESIKETTDCMGLATLRKAMIEELTSPMIFRYKKFTKKPDAKNSESRIIHTVVIPHPVTGKEIKFLISDIKLLIPSLQGYNIPKDRLIGIGSVVTVKYRDSISPTQKYVIKSIKRNKMSSPLGQNKHIQKMDVVQIQQVNSTELINVEAQTLRLV